MHRPDFFSLIFLYSSFFKMINLQFNRIIIKSLMDYFDRILFDFEFFIYFCIFFQFRIVDGWFSFDLKVNFWLNHLTSFFLTPLCSLFCWEKKNQNLFYLMNLLSDVQTFQSHHHLFYMCCLLLFPILDFIKLIGFTYVCFL